MSEPSKNNTPSQTDNTEIATQNSGAINTLSIILIVMLLLIAGLFFMNYKSSNGSSDSISDLRTRISQKEQDLRARGVAIPVDTSSVQELSDRISRDAIALKSNLGSLQQALSDKERTLNKLRTDYEAVKTINERSGAEATQLRNQIANLQGQQGNATYLQQQVKSLNDTILEKDKRLADYLNRPSSEQLANLQNSFNQAMTKSNKLETELVNLKAATANMISQDEAQKLKTQINRLVPENEALRILVQQLRAEKDYDKLYVKSVDQLLPEAAKLFRELQTLEGQSPNQLEAAYTRIGAQLNAHIVQDVKFATGASDVTFTNQSNINDKLKTTIPNSFFLVVGYASKTGGAQNNEKLSANRSATTASVVNQLLKQGQDVRAVYLGQTDRFSETPTQNQICEIWEIRK